MRGIDIQGLILKLRSSNASLAAATMSLAAAVGATQPQEPHSPPGCSGICKLGCAPTSQNLRRVTRRVGADLAAAQARLERIAQK